MGYYSDVAIGLFKKDYEKLIKEADELGYKILTIVSEKREFEADDIDTAVVLLFESVKWYGNSVDWLEKSLDKIESFRRYIGEEYSDIAEKYGGDDWNDNIYWLAECCPYIDRRLVW